MAGKAYIGTSGGITKAGATVFMAIRRKTNGFGFARNTSPASR